MTWTVLLTDRFQAWMDTLDEGSQDALYADLRVLEEFGPQLGRPHVDTLDGSAYANMKELRTRHAGHQYRSAFAFDPQRRAIVLLGGDKTGEDQRRFYIHLVKQADTLFAAHLRSGR